MTTASVQESSILPPSATMFTLSHKDICSTVCDKVRLLLQRLASEQSCRILAEASGLLVFFARSMPPVISRPSLCNRRQTASSRSGSDLNCLAQREACSHAGSSLAFASAVAPVLCWFMVKSRVLRCDQMQPGSLIEAASAQRHSVYMSWPNSG